MSGRWILLYTALCLFTIWWQGRLDERRYAVTILRYNRQAVLVWNRCDANFTCVQEIR